MSTPPASAPVRDRLLRAAAEIFADEGWRRLTMGKVADRAGVSRQTVYNEFGTKPQLAEALVFSELDGFIALVRSKIREADGPVDAISGAVDGALTLAAQNPLLKAVLESAHTGDSELIPYIASAGLVDSAANAVWSEIRDVFPDLPLDDKELLLACDTIVRVVLSHVMQPTRPPEQVGAELGWAVAMLLNGVGQDNGLGNRSGN
jgi:AcrR family transcriptional regulator